MSPRCQPRMLAQRFRREAWATPCLAGQDGASVVAVVIFLPILLLVAGLVTDVGLLFVGRHLAYQAAELGALAGAQDVDLEQLAAGQVVLVESTARADALDFARRNVAASFPRLDLGRSLQVEATVYNASSTAPARHRQTGRILTDPTVSVDIRLDVPLHFLAALHQQATVRVRADASVRTKSPN